MSRSIQNFNLFPEKFFKAVYTAIEPPCPAETLWRTTARVVSEFQGYPRCGRRLKQMAKVDPKEDCGQVRRSACVQRYCIRNHQRARRRTRQWNHRSADSDTFFPASRGSVHRHRCAAFALASASLRPSPPKSLLDEDCATIF